MRSLATASALGLAALLMTGCGMSNTGTSGPVQIAVPAMQGKIFGGQQPVSGSSIQLYQVGTTGYGSAPTPLISASNAVTTDGNGFFGLSGKYSCTSGTQVYLTATGGNAGAGTNNSLAMMVGLGLCDNLNASTYIWVNEITTVAAVWALSPFMTGTAASVNIGAPTTNTAGLAQAFLDISQIANNATGTTPGPALPTGAVSPTAEINTLADILASCINSNGSTSAGTACGRLFAAATVNGSAPANTVAAALNIAQNPTSNVSTLLGLATATAPFQPTLASANDFTLGVTYPVGALPVSVAVDAADNVWVANNGSSTVTKLTHAGSATTYTALNGGISAPTSVAVDTNGNAWITNTSNSLTEITAAGQGSNYTGGGLSAPTSVAIDGLGMIWVANGGANTLSAFSATGSALSPNSGYPTGATNGTGSVAVAINPH